MENLDEDEKEVALDKEALNGGVERTEIGNIMSFGDIGVSYIVTYFCNNGRIVKDCVNVDFTRYPPEKRKELEEFFKQGCA